MGARVIVGLNKFDHVSASMFDLHWLKIEYRMLYKVCTVVLKARNALAPSYIVDLIPQCSVREGTRSETNDPLPHTYSSTAIMRSQSFRVMSAHVWNRLPSEFRITTNFDHVKKCLKTFYFKKCYEL